MSSLRHLFTRLFGRQNPLVITLPAPRSAALDVRDRMAIRDWLSLPTTQLVLGTLESRHPGLRTARLAKYARSDWDQLAAVNFLNQIAGWELYRNTLVALAESPRVEVELNETYPSV